MNLINFDKQGRYFLLRSAPALPQKRGKIYSSGEEDNNNIILTFFSMGHLEDFLVISVWSSQCNLELQRNLFVPDSHTLRQSTHRLNPSQLMKKR